MESCDDVLDLVFFWECKAVQIPIGHNELEVASTVNQMSDLLSLRKGVSHDSNEHIEHMDDQEESRESKHCV